MRIIITVLFFIIPIQLLFAQYKNIGDYHKDKAIKELIRGNKQIALIENNEVIKLYQK